jgi:flagellar export protein FliJ
MQKFCFRLDSVLRLRSMRLTMERDKLGQALAEIARLEQQIQDLAAERAAAIAFVRNEPGAGNGELRALAAYLVGYETRLAQSQEALEAARLRVEHQRQRTIAADRDERLLLKLQAQRRAEWQLAADRELEGLAQESWNAVHFNPRD